MVYFLYLILISKGEGLHNEKSNLRDGSNGVNNRNRRMNINNTTGENGIYWDKSRNRWMICWRENNKRYEKYFTVPYHGKKDDVFLREKKRVRKDAIYYRDCIYILIENENGIRPKYTEESSRKKQRSI